MPAAKPDLQLVVLDPAHGGADSGARGSSGAVEKDIVLEMTRAARSEFERQGLRVAFTRDGDQDRSAEERAAVVNAQRQAIFLSLHVSSTGAPGTVRVYSFGFPAAVEVASAAPKLPSGFREWDMAQRPYSDLSRRLADLLQVEVAQTFPPSPEISTTAAVRGLRYVAAPAAAVEISSVSVSDPKTLQAMIPKLAAALARGVNAFRPLYAAGIK